MNQALSLTAEATIDKNAKQFASKSVMGFRIRFPEAEFKQLGKDPASFTIPAFEPG